MVRDEETLSHWSLDLEVDHKKHHPIQEQCLRLGGTKKKKKRKKRRR